MSEITIGCGGFLRKGYDLVLDSKVRFESRHRYRARIKDFAIEVTDKNAQPVKVIFAATRENRTVYACVEGVGFIGGWKDSHEKVPLGHLAESINRGILYLAMDDLPKRFKPEVCSHCGGEL